MQISTDLVQNALIELAGLDACIVGEQPQAVVFDGQFDGVAQAFPEVFRCCSISARASSHNEYSSDNIGTDRRNTPAMDVWRVSVIWRSRTSDSS